MRVGQSFRERMVRPTAEVISAPVAIDPLMAALAKGAGFDTVYLAGGVLGYTLAVTEALLTVTEVAERVRSIREVVDGVSVVADAGVGFGDAVHTARAVRALEQAGACAVEIEDQVAPKRVHHHKGVEHLVSTDEMVGKIRAAADARRNLGTVIIARCNAIAHEGVRRALDRGAAYVEAGADVLMFRPVTATDFEEVTRGTSVPLAAMAAYGPTRPDSEMAKAGYSLSVYPFPVFVLAFEALRGGYQRLRQGTINGRGTGMTPREIGALIDEVGSTIGVEQLYEIEARTTEAGIGRDTETVPATAGG